MPEFSIAALPEVFVSNSSISKFVYDAVDRGQLRKLGSRLRRSTPPSRLCRLGLSALI